MTNEEFLKSLTGKKFIDYMQKILSQDFSKCVDWEKWLQSEDRTFVYLGKPGQYASLMEEGKEIEWSNCQIIRETDKFPIPYVEIVAFEENSKPKLLYVPASYIKGYKPNIISK